MISAFHWQAVLRIVLGLCLAIFAGLSMADWPETLLKQANLAITLTIGLLVVFGSNWGLWRRAWDAFPRLNRWVYPDLNGTWRGSLSSNWQVIERMAKAAKGEIPAFDPFAPSELFNRQSVPMTLRIRAGWFRIHVRMETDNRYSNSRTLSVMPERGRDGDPHAISYIFENSTPDAVATDSAHHRGAARLEIGLDGGEPILEGVVWTDRNWQKGLNTAGLLRVKRISRDPEASVPV